MSLFIRAVSERYLPLQNEQAMRNMFQLLRGDIVIIQSAFKMTANLQNLQPVEKHFSLQGGGIRVEMVSVE